MFCPKCGEILPDSAKTCRVCGAALGSSQEKKPVKASYQRTYSASRSHASHQHHYGGTGSQKCYTTFQQQTTYAQGEGKLEPKEAVLRFFRRYADFKGRSSRSEFLWPFLMVIVGSILVGTIFTGLSVLWVFALVTPFCALTARRFHDIGVDGRLGLLLLVPFAGALMVVVLCAKPSGPENKWGPQPRQ